MAEILPPVGPVRDPLTSATGFAKAPDRIGEGSAATRPLPSDLPVPPPAARAPAANAAPLVQAGDLAQENAPLRPMSGALPAQQDATVRYSGGPGQFYFHGGPDGAHQNAASGSH